MTIPPYHRFLRPVLECLDDGKTRTRREIIDEVLDAAGLPEAERARMLPSGRQTIADNRVSWALTYLKQAGLVTSPARARYAISEAGRELLREVSGPIGLSALERFESFRAFRDRTRSGGASAPAAARPDAADADADADETPEERIDAAYIEHRRGLEDEILEMLRSVSPSWFEHLVVRLLVAMGYGGDFEDAAEAVGGTGDGGIDGIIKADRLGLDAVYVQAKRWGGVVGRPEIQKFAGALSGLRARKGVFLTTSGFTAQAREYCETIDTTIVLIDGRRLAELMFEYDVGVTREREIAIKRIDREAFGDE